MNANDAAEQLFEAVVDAEGNAVISSRQLPKLAPGAHLQVQVHLGHEAGTPLRGSLPNIADLTWEDFVEVSKAARADVERSFGGP